MIIHDSNHLQECVFCDKKNFGFHWWWKDDENVQEGLFISYVYLVPEIAGSPVKVCFVGTAWLDLALFRQFLPNIGIFA